MSPRLVIKFVEYVTRQDPTGEVAWSAVCVSGDDSDCGEESGPKPDDQAVIDWMSEHRARTGHARYRRRFEDYALTEPKG